MFLTSQILLLSSLLSIVMCRHRHSSLTERHLERKRQRSLNQQRLAMLNNNVLKMRNVEILNDIPHYRQTRSSPASYWKKIIAIENDFRRLLAMDKMKYDFKRDLYWRTWRSIQPVNSPKEIVCYKCFYNNPQHVNGTECQNCGMWTIDELPPPCPYEFFSLISDKELCGANYTQYKNVKDSCPSVIKFSELKERCNNPIETQWRFSKLYGMAQNHDDVICGDKHCCEIFTSYEIAPAHVIFRIINSTNDIIYSRIMKPNNMNYICAEDCGRLNPETGKFATADKFLSLDLLHVRNSKGD